MAEGEAAGEMQPGWVMVMALEAVRKVTKVDLIWG